MENKKIEIETYENEIFEEIKDQVKNLSKKELEELLTFKLKEKDLEKYKILYAQEDSVHYGKERIKNKINKYYKDKIIKKDGEKNFFEYLIIFICFFIFLSLVKNFFKTDSTNNYSKKVEKINYNKSDINDQSDFYEFKIKDIGSISIPNNMEVQAGIYKEINDLYLKQFINQFDYEVSGDQIIFQQKGLNDFNKDSFETYARIIIKTEKNLNGDYNNLKTPLELSEKDLINFNSFLKKGVEDELLKINIKIIDWKGTSIVSVNKIDALKTSFVRQLVNNPLVFVEQYIFLNNDRIYTLVLSYRLEESDLWQDKMDDVIRSFEITNVIE